MPLLGLHRTPRIWYVVFGRRYAMRGHWNVRVSRVHRRSKTQENCAPNEELGHASETLSDQAEDCTEQ